MVTSRHNKNRICANRAVRRRADVVPAVFFFQRATGRLQAEPMGSRDRGAADVKSLNILSRRHYRSATISRDWRLLATLVAGMIGRGVLIASGPNKT